MAEEVTAADLRVKPRDVVYALAFAVVVAVVASFAVSAIVDPPPTTTQPAPVARVTTEELRAMAALARAILDDPESSRAERLTARQLAEVVDAVENGEVQIVPESTAPQGQTGGGGVSQPAPSTSAPTTSTTTTAPLGSRQNPAPWPSVPPVTLPDVVPGG